MVLDDRLIAKVDCSNCKKNCCEEGYFDIYLTESEINNINSISGVAFDDFVKTTWNPYLGYLIKTLNHPCPFYVDKRCAIQKNKPLICKLFPFTMDVLGNGFWLESHFCYNFLTENESSATENVIDVRQYAADIDRWLHEFWSR